VLWVAALVLAPPVLLRGGYLISAVIFSALGLLVVHRVFAHLAPARGRVVLWGALNLALCGVGLWSVGLLARPFTGGWSLVPGTDGWSDVALVFAGGERLALRSPSGGNVLGRLTDSGWDLTPYPGGNTWSLQVSDGRVVAAPQDGREILLLDPGAREWRRVPRPNSGFVRHLRVDSGVFLVTSARSYRMGTEGQWEPFGPPLVTDLCRAGASWVMVSATGIYEGPSESGDEPVDSRIYPSTAGSRIYPSTDAIRLVHGWRASFPQAACAPDGRAYAIDDGLVRGQLRARQPDGSWAARSLPAPDVRVAVVNPADGRELWLSTWGAGVFRSRDGGESWENLGLVGVEIRSMAVDFTDHRVWVAPSNLVGHSGIWERPFSP
jgi:hypothetical protein